MGSQATVDHAHTSSAEERRFVKACALLEQLQVSRIPYTYAAARRLTQDQRRVVERMAGYRRASDETWKVTLALLRGTEHPQ